MGKICIIKSCPSGRKRKNKINAMPQLLSFFMPKTSERLAKWSNSLHIDLKPTDYVCHLHFKEDDIKMYEKIVFNGIPKFFPLGRKMLKENAIPMIKHQFNLTLVKELQENIIDAQQQSNFFIEEQQRHDYVNEKVRENSQKQSEIRRIQNYSEHQKIVAQTVDIVDLTDNGENIPLLPPFWLYKKKLKGFEFMRMDPSNGRIINHIRLNENSSITVILPNDEEVQLNERITSFDNIYNYLKSVEKWLICVGTQIEKKKYSKNCKRVIYGDDVYERCPMNPRCKACRKKRNQLQKASSTPSTVDKSITKKHRSENFERKCKRPKVSQGSPSYEALEDEDGQEEWLSEGLLTDDDCNTTMENMNISQEESRISQQSDEQANDTEDSQTNIEEKLNNLENSQTEQEEAQVTKGKQGSDEDSKNSKDDGNDTDDLLRMLGDEGNKKKKKVLKMTKKNLHQESSGEDEEFEFFENAKKAKHLKMAKTVLIKSHPAKKAVPEDSDTDMEDASDKNNSRVNNSRMQSSDGANVVKRMFGVRKVNVASKSTAKSSLAYITDRVNNTPGKVGAAAIATRSKMKPDQASKPSPTGSLETSKSQQKHVEVNRASQSSRTLRILSTQSQSQSQLVETKSTPNKKKQEEQVREEKNPKEDSQRLVVVKTKSQQGQQGHVTEKEESKRTHQLMMSPEQMDEEMLSDEESQSEIGSVCDEMPLSDSDDTEDWFTLDIRAERAGEYLPLLGPVAHQLLLEEKARVTTKLAQMRESLTEVTDKSRMQANLLKNASTTLTQLEALISST